MEGVHFVVYGEVFGNSQRRLDSERKKKAWSFLTTRAMKQTALRWAVASTSCAQTTAGVAEPALIANGVMSAG